MTHISLLTATYIYAHNWLTAVASVCCTEQSLLLHYWHAVKSSLCLYTGGGCMCMHSGFNLYSEAGVMTLNQVLIAGRGPAGVWVGQARDAWHDLMY